MRTLTMILSAVLLTLITTRATAMETCKIVTGYGTAIGKGKNKLEAKEQARLTCGSKLIDQYFAQRQQVPENVKEDLALACINLECQ